MFRHVVITTAMSVMLLCSRIKKNHTAYNATSRKTLWYIAEQRFIKTYLRVKENKWYAHNCPLDNCPQGNCTPH